MMEQAKSRHLYLIVLFSFLSVVASECVAVGDLLNAQKVIEGFSQNQLLENALDLFNKHGSTNAGRALSKHPAMAGETKQSFNQVYRTIAQQNEAALEILKEIISKNQGKIIENKRWGKLFEIRGADGRGARWQLDGTFIGFVD